MSHSNHEDRDDYLWDRSGPVDAEVAALERLLSGYRLQDHAPRVSRPMRERAVPHRKRHVARRRTALASLANWRVAMTTAAMLAVSVIGVIGWYQHRLQWPQARPWSLAVRGDTARIDGAAVAGQGILAPGSVLDTGRDTSVRLRAARIGEVVVGEGSRFELIVTRSGLHRTRLHHGRLWARVWAPPGAFGVGSAAGDVLDLGCEFVLDVRKDGRGALTVRSGWVQVDNGWREVLVPQGARVEFGAGGEAGTPYDLGARADFVAALREIDADPVRIAADGDAVRRLVATARAQDAITLLSLLQAQPRLADGPVYDRLAAQMPEAVVSRAAARGGGHALSPWWQRLPYPRMKRWWLQWPDVFVAREDADALLRDDVRRR